MAASGTEVTDPGTVIMEAEPGLDLISRAAIEQRVIACVLRSIGLGGAALAS